MDVAKAGNDGFYNDRDGLANASPPVGSPLYQITNSNGANFVCNLNSGRQLQADDYIVMRITAKGSWASKITHIELIWGMAE